MRSDEKSGSPIVRIAVIGSTNVGKSALTVRYLTHRYIGEYRRNTDLLYRQTLTLNKSSLDVEIVDVCSSNMEHNFPEEAIFWADACVVVYDITNAASFENGCRLLRSTQQLRPQLPVVLLGNKCDLEHLRAISFDDGQSVANRQHCSFHEVSVAENSASIYTAIDLLVSQCKEHMALTTKTRKFSMSKMLGTLLSSSNNAGSNNKPTATPHGGTVVVCQKSDLSKCKTFRRRRNFTATASL